MRSIFIYFAIVLVSGCTTVGGAVTENVEEIADGRGLVVFSTTSYEVSTFFPVALTLVNGENHKKYDKVIIIINSNTQKSSFTDVHATVRTLDLPIGKYYLIGWHPNPYVETVKSPVFEFEVKNKNVAYIGNIYYNGAELTWSSDYKKRDIEYFVGKNPYFLQYDFDDQNIKSDISFEDFKVDGIIWGVP